MPRAIRCNLPNQPYECSTRTVNEQFLLNPLAAPGRLSPQYNSDRPFDRKQRRRDARIAEKNAHRLSVLIQRVKAWRAGLGPEPEVTVENLPETVNNIIGTWLAKAIAHTGITFYGFVVMSNHPHHLLSHKDGKLDAFFQYFNGQVARALNRFHGRRHQLWARRYSAIPVLDEQTDIERLLYFLTNPQKANLVDTLKDWPGLSSASFYLGDNKKQNEYLFFDRTKWNRTKKPRSIAKFLHIVKLKHTVLPALAHMDEPQRKALLQRLLDENESALRDIRQGQERNVLGKRGLQETDSSACPKKPKTSPLPLCLCSDRELRIAFITARYRYTTSYRDITHAYRDAEKPQELELPLGAYPPPKLIRYRYPPDPDRSALPNLTVR
jgi:hypothetical protein